MRPLHLGRALGIGTRLAAKRILPTPLPPPTPAQRQAASAQRLRTGAALGRQTRSAARSTGQLGRAVWNPFAHATAILWLEITGLFFSIFALLFLQHLWTLRTSYRVGPEHAHFVLYAVFAAVFTYFAASSFLGARKRARRTR